MNTRRSILGLVIAIAAMGPASSAFAQGDDSYPSRPIRVLLPLSPGSTTDIVARMFAERLGQRLHQSVVVENKPGAGGTIAAHATARSAPDGYTLLLVNSQHAINPSAYNKLPYDTMHDFEGIALVCDSPMTVTVPAETGARTLKEFIGQGKQRPAQIAYASSGVGSQTHLAGAYFASRAGISLLHVPYKSSSEVLTDLVSNRIQSVFAPAAYQMPLIEAGKLRVLAISGKERLSIMPDVPTISEAGIPGYEFNIWFGFIVPAKVPAQIKAVLARELKAIAEEPDIKKKLAEQGMTTRVITLGDFDKYIASEIQRLAPLVKSSGVKEKL
jgi:tripartite-type tricarboxylate transporter receptor subunit TctC